MQNLFFKFNQCATLKRVSMVITSLTISLALIGAGLSPLSAAEFPNDLDGGVDTHRMGLLDVTATLQIVSAAPSTDSMTQFEASGTWPTGCVPELESVDASTMGYVIITAVAERIGMACGQVESEWAFSIEHQFDVPDYYMIDLVIKNETLDTKDYLASTPVVVAGGLSVRPQSPDPSESFTISTDGLHRDGCVPDDASYSVVDSTIVIDVMTPDLGEFVCTQALSPWQMDVEIEGLDGGDYTVEIYTADLYAGEVQNRSLHITRELSVGVSAAQSSSFFVYLPEFVRE